GTVVVFGGFYAAPVNVNKALSAIQASTNSTTSTQDAVNITGPVTLTNDATFAMTGVTRLTFVSAIDAASAGAAGLAVDGRHPLQLSAAVGGTTALSFLTTDAGGGTLLNGGSVRTTGAQTYNDPVTLGGATTLTSTGGGSIAFTSTVDGAVSLAVNTAGT